MCIACSGVHRSLGVHHSKVRSLTLDAWEPEIIKVMMELGNQIVNRVYEGRIDDEIQRATETCEDSVREAWIKAKYVQKRFVLPLLENANDSLVLLSDTAVEVEDDFAAAGSQQQQKGNAALAEGRVVRRWSVRRLRRRPKNKSHDSDGDKAIGGGGVGGGESSSSTTTGDDSSSDHSLIVIGQNLSAPQLKDELALSSDQESTCGEDDNNIIGM